MKYLKCVMNLLGAVLCLPIVLVQAQSTSPDNQVQIFNQGVTLLAQGDTQQALKIWQGLAHEGMAQAQYNLV